MRMRVFLLALLGACTASAQAVTNGWQLQISTNGTVQTPPRVSAFTFTNAMTVEGSFTMRGGQDLHAGDTTWGLGESVALTWAGTTHLIGGSINGSTNGGQLFLGGVGQVISDDSAGIVRVSAGWTQAIQAASPPAVVTSVSYATNAGTAAALSAPYVAGWNGQTGNVTAPYVASVNGQTGDVTVTVIALAGTNQLSAVTNRFDLTTAAALFELVRTNGTSLLNSLMVFKRGSTTVARIRDDGTIIAASFAVSENATLFMGTSSGRAALLSRADGIMGLGLSAVAGDAAGNFWQNATNGAVVATGQAATTNTLTLDFFRGTTTTGPNARLRAGSFDTYDTYRVGGTNGWTGEFTINGTNFAVRGGLIIVP